MENNEFFGPTESVGEKGGDDVLVAENLKKTFRLSAKQRKIEKTPLREKVAVAGVSFHAKRGEIYGLLGPNGAGKTTTLRMLATLIKPDEGDALVNGFSIVKQPDKVRSQIGFLTSELKPDDFFTPSYIFDFFSELQNIPAQVRDERKKMLFSRFGIDKFSETKISDLSTGMKQKTSIAVSLDSYREIDAWMTNLAMTEDSFTRLQDIIDNAGELDHRVDFSDLVDTSYANEAYKDVYN